MSKNVYLQKMWTGRERERERERERRERERERESVYVFTSAAHTKIEKEKLINSSERTQQGKFQNTKQYHVLHKNETTFVLENWHVTINEPLLFGVH